MNHSPKSLRFAALAVAAASTLVLTACGGSSSGASGSPEASGNAVSTVRVAVFPSFNALGAHAAELEGIFEKKNLDVQFVTVATPAEGMPQLLGGKVDMALMDVTTPVVARSEKVPVVMVAPGATGTKVNDAGMGTGNFWVAKDSKFTSVKDLENSTFGIPQTKSQIWVDVRTAVDAAGGDSSKIKFVEVPNGLSAVKSGAVDVTTTAEPGGTAAKADPQLRLLSGYTPGEVGELAYTYVTSEQYATANPAAVDRFAEAILEADKKLNETEGLAPQVAATYIDAPKDLLDRAVYQKFGTDKIDAKIVEQAIDRVLRYQLIEKDAAPSVDDLLAGK